jgi:hypothetical protein
MPRQVDDLEHGDAGGGPTSQTPQPAEPRPSPSHPPHPPHPPAAPPPLHPQITAGDPSPNGEARPPARSGTRGDRPSHPPPLPPFTVERVQTGVRMEKRLVKVLKALAELYDMSLGDLLEGIVLHAFDGRTPFSEESLVRIAELKRIYGLELDSRASHRLIEQE